MVAQLPIPGISGIGQENEYEYPGYEQTESQQVGAYPDEVSDYPDYGGVQAYPEEVSDYPYDGRYAGYSA